uniref:PPM-type phosphatase domain-containing protein n=1 Tax=Hyaloperonospora arabidopsidis (strain Emoy2) TaxID=559515 RepID=M4BZT5_HYAAE
MYDVPVGIAADRGAKLSQEDAYFIGGKVVERLTLNGYSDSASGCFGIFDGHAGDRASRFCAENIFPRILDQLARKLSVRKAITNAVRALDADFCAIAHRYSTSAIAFAARHSHGRSFATDDGSTLLVAIVRDGLLHVGNVGDSRAIVVTRYGEAIPMSIDQKPSRKDERKRLKAKGAFITGKPSFMYKMWPLKNFLDVPRVNGQLAVSRSIGDVSLKAFITCDPEVQTRRISKYDRFLIMATDGLWDVVSSKTAARIASRYRDPQAAANALVAFALGRHTTDNITVLVVKLEAYDFSDSCTDITSG